MSAKKTVHKSAPSQEVPETEIVVRKYGLLQPLNWGDDCDMELRRMVELWNALVRIEQHARHEYKKLIYNDPDLLRVSSEICESDSKRATLVRKRSEMRFTKQKKSDIDALSAELTKLNQELRELKRKAGVLSSKNREKLRTELRSIENWRRSEVKLARQRSRLWWGNYNAVVSAYEKGRTSALKKGGELTSRVYDGSGRITNQIQQGMSVADLFSGRHSQVAVAPIPEDAWSHSSRGERRRLQRTTFTATIFTQEGERRTVTWPMVMHRPIPQGCRIKTAVVTRRKLIDKWQWHVIFTCTQAVAPRSTMSACRQKAVQMGWRRVPGGIRVATVVADTDGETQSFIIPEAIVEGFAFADSLRAKRYELLNATHQWLTRIDWSAAPIPLAERGRAAQQLPANISYFSELAAEWLRYPEWRPEDRLRLADWRSESKRLSLWEGNQRDKLLRRRTDLYRRFARDIVIRASSIAMNALDLADLSRADRYNGRESPLTMISRRYRAIASLSTLRKFLSEKSVKSGVELLHVDAGKSRICHLCLSPVQYAVKPFDPFHKCEYCSEKFDKDINSCKSILTNIKMK